MRKKQQNRGMFEQQYNSIVMSFTMAAREATPVRIPFRQHIPAWNVAVSESELKTLCCQKWLRLLKDDIRWKDFEYALKACRNTKDEHNADAIASSMEDHSPKTFGKTRSITKGMEKSMRPSSMKDATRNEAIAAT